MQLKKDSFLPNYCQFARGSLCGSADCNLISAFYNWLGLCWVKQYGNI